MYHYEGLSSTLRPFSALRWKKMPDSFQMTPQELKERWDRGEKITLLDVREPDEYRLANLGGTLIPLQELPRRLEELDPAAEMVVLCHHGIRSAQATAFLRQAGFEHVKNLAGGIERWSVQIDPLIPRY